MCIPCFAVLCSGEKKPVTDTFLAASSISLSLHILGKNPCELLFFLPLECQVLSSPEGLASGDGKKIHGWTCGGLECGNLHPPTGATGFNWVNFHFLARCHFHFCFRMRCHVVHWDGASRTPVSSQACSFYRVLPRPAVLI